MDDVEVDRLLKKAGVEWEDAGTQEVLRSAMRTAADVTHERGTPEATDDAVLGTFRDALRHARISERVAGVRLRSAGPSIGRDGAPSFAMSFEDSQGLINAMAEGMVTFFKGEGAVNYVEVKVHHSTEGDFTLCVQRTAGKTPHELRKAAEEKLAALVTASEAVLDTITMGFSPVGKDRHALVDELGRAIQAAKESKR